MVNIFLIRKVPCKQNQKIPVIEKNLKSRRDRTSILQAKFTRDVYTKFKGNFKITLI